jgi:hypothetical protein
MLLSTSSFKVAEAWTATVRLVVALALLYGAVELVSAFGFSRLSRIQRRVNTEAQQARSLPAERNGKPTLLLVGNSLPLEGVDVEHLRADLAPYLDVNRFVIESTQYNDWYFGLKRLIGEGSRPRILLISMSTDHLILNSVRGAYFAHYLMRGRDIFEVARRAHLDNTTASTMWLARWSPWLGGQSEMRQFLLYRIMPSFQKLTPKFISPAPPQPPADVVEETATKRLRELRELAEPYGIRVVFLLPPTLLAQDNTPAVAAAGANTGVSVLSPYLPGEMPEAEFSDKFHLNQAGAALFTARLERQLRDLLKLPAE